MQTKTVSVLLAAIFILSVSLAAKPLPDRKKILQKVKSGKASVPEYFLACSLCTTEMDVAYVKEGFAFRNELLTAKKATYYSGSPSDKKNKRLIKVTKKIIRPEMGYIQISGIDDKEPFTYTSQILVSNQGQRFYAWTYFHGENTHRYQFFDPTKPEWENVEGDLLPHFSMADFSVTNADFDMENNIQWQIILPEKGITAFLIPHPDGLITGDEANLKKYREYIGSNYAMRLHWDKTKGKFAKGKVLDKEAFIKDKNNPEY